MKQFSPVFVNLSNKKIVIIGGGQVALRRLKGLLPYHQQITVVSPAVTDELDQLIQDHQIDWRKEKCELRHFENADFIVIATNKEAVNQYIVDHAPSHAWINASHRSEDGNVQFPITLTRGKLQIAISTGGASPILAKKIKRAIEQEIPDQYEQYVDFLYQARTLLIQQELTPQLKKQLLAQLIEEPIYDKDEQQAWLHKQSNRT
ncbi:NAD(P)-binding protein [Gracilibacillus caseinilyticus]|uniref:precorrin-2 dehydrogenase n=1 Tax=Gracilibacillus caseinilyticus TaxID=2932256 RepID=A0ABY4EW14_9BACI|nr:NAD(P)-binding protein [Gracilibacillus caseinilyticus]UOQ48063.1 NAD(P)-binding protein [Gracilibacillus caseinilyticus]